MTIAASRACTCRAGILFALALVALAGCDYLPVSGGRLDGAVSPLPDDLTGIAGTEIIQLETSAPDGSAYSVNLWIVEVSGSLHVFAGDNRSAWVENIERDAAVRLGVREAIYELEAQRVIDPEQFERFARAWDAKYGNRPRNENVAETYLFRLTPR